MASFLNKIWSGLDFWQKDENQRQRDQFAQEDEEERKRRERAAAFRAAANSGSAGNAPAPGTTYDPSATIKKIASQSGLTQDPLNVSGMLKKVKPLTPEQKKQRALDAAAQASQESEQYKNRSFLDKVKQDFIPSLKKATGEAAVSVGTSVARVGTGIGQGISGLYDLASPGKGNNRVTKVLNKAAEAEDKFAKEHGNDKIYKVGNVVGEGASYLVGAGAFKGLSELPKLARSTKLTEELADAIARRIGGANPEGVRGILQAGVKEGMTVDNILNDAAINAKFFGQDTAEGRKITPGEVVENIAMSGVGAVLPPAFRRLVAKGDKQGEGILSSATLKSGRELTETGLKKVDAGVQPRSVEIAPGIHSTNLAKVKEPIDVPVPTDNEPAFVRRGRQQAEAAQVAEREVEDFAKDPLNKPAYQHKREIQDIMDQGQSELDNFVRENPGATVAQLEEAKTAINQQIADEIAKLQETRYGTPNVADTTAPVAKVGTSAEEPSAPIADFRDGVNVPLKKVAPEAEPAPVVTPKSADVEQAARTGDTSAVSGTDINGNPNLISDAEAAKRLTREGVPINPEASVTATNEQAMSEAADRAARESIDTGGPAPRTREQAASRLSDEELRNDVIENFPEKQTLNIADTEARAKAAINNMSDEQLIASFNSSSIVDTPEDFFMAVNSIRRLEQIDTPEARTAIQNAIDSLAEYSSRSGRNLRTTQILFDDMPTSMKVDYLMNKLSKAGADMSDQDRSILANLVAVSDESTDKLRSLENEANDLLDSGAINNESMAGEVRQRAQELSREIQQAMREKELRAGAAWRFYQESMPPSSIGKRFGDLGRTLMLSAPSGRVFDILSTTSTATDDLLTGGLSSLLGKGVNAAKGRGSVVSTLPSPRQLAKGFREGLTRTKESFQGKDHVEDFLGQAKRSTRGDINTGGGTFRRVVRSLVETPTNLSRGIRTNELYKQGMQEAQQQGLKGAAARTYAELRAAVPSEQQLHQASEAHLKVNMLHDNRISRFLNNIANSLDKGAGGWAAPFIRNQVAPFTSWLGGNLNRTLTDKNILYNVGAIANAARKGDLQGALDNVSKLAVNAGEAYVAGLMLTRAGIITDHDANGDNYAGLYFHIGDRYIPVAVAGTFSVPIILGNAFDKGLEAEDGGNGFADGFINSLAQNTVKNAGVASVFGGDNNLQSTVMALADDNTPISEDMTKYVGDFVRQYIPALTGDINSFLDYTKLNPTGEAPETKVTKENPETGREKTDVLATELARTAGRIPFLSQNLPRKDGVPAKDFGDRSLHSNRETGEMAQERQKKETQAEIDKDREKRGVPDTLEKIDVKTEDGDYDLAIEGYKWQMEKKSADETLSKTDKKEYEDKIKILEVTRDGGYEPEFMQKYDDTSLTEWRKMGDPDSEDYDPETYARLAEYDKKRTAAGVSDYSSDHTKTKYYDKSSERGGGSGRGRKGPKLETGIATQSFSPSFKPIKVEGASFAAPQSRIPTIQKVPNYDMSKVKKISVRSGAGT